MKKLFAAAAALSVLLAGSAFAADQNADKKVLATVAGETITQADLNQAMSGFDPQQRAAYASPEGQAQLLDNLIDFKVFARSGREQKLQNSPKYKEAMANLEQRLLFTLATEKILDEAGKTPATDQDAQKYYDEHKEIFQVPAAIRASHILIRADKNMPAKDQKAAQEKAADLIRDIKAGKTTFEDAAKNNSADGTRSRGGDLGYFSKGQMVPEFEKAAFALKKGEMTAKPVKTDFGYHVIKATDSRDASIRPFAEVKEDIKADLVRQKQVKAIQDERDALRARYGVKIAAPEAPASGDKKPAK